MNLKICGQHLSLTVPFSKQDFTRDIEHALNALYTDWRRKFPAKSDREVLAMVAFQYASHYGELMERYNAASRLTEDCLALLSDNSTSDSAGFDELTFFN